jgi:tRNA nucleotidyltransferase (CCA-adding enzyme)
LEVTTFRKDVETTGRHAVVEFSDTLMEDLARRDFTINAVAWHPLREEFQDPFDGRRDLREGILRTVGDPEDRFAEDYLRVLRALRFSGRFRLRVETSTWAALCDSAPRLGVLSPERIREELLKVLTYDARPSGSLSLYAACGVLDALYPELAALGGCPRPGREEDLWTHSLLLTDQLSPKRPTLRLAALLHGVGVPPEGPGPSQDPDSLGRDRAAALLMRGRYSNAEIREVAELIEVGLEPPLELTERSDHRRWLHRADPDRLSSFARVWLGKARLDQYRFGIDPKPVLDLLLRLRKEIRARPPLRLDDLEVNGRDLIAAGLKPGPRFGEILAKLMDKVLGDPSLNRRDLLLTLVQEAEMGEEGE